MVEYIGERQEELPVTVIKEEACHNRGGNDKIKIAGCDGKYLRKIRGKRR